MKKTNDVRRAMLRWMWSMVWVLALGGGAPGLALAQPAPDELIRSLSTQTLERIRKDAALRNGDFEAVARFVDETIMPSVNFERMTALAVGRGWRQASTEQKAQLMVEFRALLVRTYAGALSSVKDQQVRVKPLRAAPDATDVIVRSEIIPSRGEPIQLDYRMEKADNGWRIYDLNVMGVWLLETYRNQFAQEISQRGIDGLIRSLAERNRQTAAAGRA